MKKILGIIGLLALLAFMVGVLISLYETKIDNAYQQGAVDAAKLAKEASKEIQADLALQWWVGTKDMSKVREKLCSNYSNRVKK